MNERECNYCSIKIGLPHTRVWEEDKRVSKMLTFCCQDHMVRYYIEEFLLEHKLDLLRWLGKSMNKRIVELTGHK
jgi:hypothetical protein